MKQRINSGGLGRYLFAVVVLLRLVLIGIAMTHHWLNTERFRTTPKKSPFDEQEAQKARPSTSQELHEAVR